MIESVLTAIFRILRQRVWCAHGWYPVAMQAALRCRKCGLERKMKERKA